MVLTTFLSSLPRQVQLRVSTTFDHKAGSAGASGRSERLKKMPEFSARGLKRQMCIRDRSVSRVLYSTIFARRQGLELIAIHLGGPLPDRSVRPTSGAEWKRSV